MQTYSSIYRRIGKPTLDAMSASAMLVACLPLLVAIAIAVRIGMGAPVLFAQPRSGKHGRIFRIYKFRTMTSQRGPDGQLLPDELRLTWLGRWLRDTSLDELPELWNVIRGEMSLVGPRPLLTEYLTLYTPDQAQRLEVKPGLTGLAQVSGRNLLSWDQKFELDQTYVKQVSLRLDLAILCKTFVCVWRRTGTNTVSDGVMPRFTGSESVSSPLAARAA